jgi:hypothetical protein
VHNDIIKQHLVLFAQDTVLAHPPQQFAYYHQALDKPFRRHTLNMVDGSVHEASMPAFQISWLVSVVPSNGNDRAALTVHFIDDVYFVKLLASNSLGQLPIYHKNSTSAMHRHLSISPFAPESSHIKCGE